MYEPMSYYVTDPPEGMSGTMIWLREFNDYMRDDDTMHIALGTPFNKSSNEATLFYIMQSHESTHQGITCRLTHSKPLGLKEWKTLIDDCLMDLLEDTYRILTLELRPDLEWWLYEFIGWTIDPNVHNPEEAAQTFKLSGHPIKTTHGKRHTTHD